MKTIIYEGSDGKLHRSIIRDDDPDGFAEEGIPLDPPMIEDILEAAKIELHNELVRKGLFDVKSLDDNRGALQSVVNRVITNKIVRRYLENK